MTAELMAGVVLEVEVEPGLVVAVVVVFVAVVG